MKIEERIRISTQKTKRIIDALVTLLQLRAVNEVVLYSDALSTQVGTSYAANAYNVVTAALFESELVRLCALWDPARNEGEARDRDSIPAVAWLMDAQDVDEQLAEAIRQDRSTHPIKLTGGYYDKATEDALKLVVKDHAKRDADNEREKLLARIAKVKEKISETEKSQLLVALRNFRDKHIAHALVETKAEKRGRVIVPKYGDEAKLFELSVDIVNDLNYVLCDASFVWDMAREQTARCSKALWSKCQFNILE